MASTVLANSIAADVWSKVWRNAPTVERDDLLLSRERRGPRWQEIVTRLECAFGTINGLTTIELGSGRGDLSALLAERGAKVTLLDTCPAALEQATWRFDRLGLKASLVEADMFTTPASLIGRFDVAMSSGVIEHFVGDRRTDSLIAHRNVLRPGGMTIVSVPHAACIPYRVWKLYLELRRRWPYGVERPYSAREIGRRARAAALESVETKAVGLWHSLSAHWARDLLQRDVDWSHRRSRLDNLMGLILLMFGRRAGGMEHVECGMAHDD